MRRHFTAALEGRVGDHKVCVGSHELVHGARKPEQWAVHVLRRAAWRSALSVFVAVDGRTVGALLLGDELRRETPRAVQTLRNAGVARIVMVTGDRADAAETIGAALDLDAVLANRVPSDRLAKDLAPADADRYLVRDAQRVIEAIESLVRLHNAQGEAIYEHAVAG